jgi:hypothetical protein
MKTINDIQFDKTIFPSYTKWSLILYQINGTSIAIPLPNANLMSFIHPFEDISHCQHHIGTNNQKECALFAYSDNFVDWTCNSNVIPANLKDIYIFCPDDDMDFIRQWANRFGQITNIILYDKLDRELLIFGVKYLRDVRSYYKHDQGVWRLVNEDYIRICQALKDTFQQQQNV